MKVYLVYYETGSWVNDTDHTVLVRGFVKKEAADSYCATMNQFLDENKCSKKIALDSPIRDFGTRYKISHLLTHKTKKDLPLFDEGASFYVEEDLLEVED